MQARIKWKDGASFLAESGSGHTVLMDGPPEAGGKNSGPRPMEMLLMGTGGCAAFDVVMILKKSRQDISDCVVKIEAERASQEPKVFTRIHFHFILTGKRLNSRQVERAISLSAEKYCSASIMLAKTAELTHDFEIVEE
jgi:putative redox protein